ncbi:MAG: ATPase [Oleibacter sp.]|nr:ATPase [Thalassolituus sp.]
MNKQDTGCCGSASLKNAGSGSVGTESVAADSGCCQSGGADSGSESCCAGDVKAASPEPKEAVKESCCASSVAEKSSCCSSSKAEIKTAAAGSCCGTEVNAADSCCSSSTKHAAATVSSCCGGGEEDSGGGCCGPSDGKKRIDWIMWICLPLVAVGYALSLIMGHGAGDELASEPSWLSVMAHTSYEMVNAMWWGILTAAFFVGILGRIPRELVMSVLGRGGTKRGIFRATLAGLMLDLCNHGILMVGMKLYERGASIGQVMAFLIASPWNSLTLTLILIGLIGLKWTLLFIVFSMLVAWVSGWIFDRLVANGTLPANPYQESYTEVAMWPTLKQTWGDHDWSPAALAKMFWQGLKESKMVLRWVVFGVVLVALIRAFVPAEEFGVWFGASFGGLVMTLIATTIIEVCSEGSSPIAADLFNRAGAPGNAFTFLMAGAATDYTEIMALKETTASWKISLFLPLITVPQVLFIGWIMNLYGA